MNDALYEVELAKAQVEFAGPIIVGFFVLHHAKLRTSELYYNILTKVCDVAEFD